LSITDKSPPDVTRTPRGRGIGRDECKRGRRRLEDPSKLGEKEVSLSLASLSGKKNKDNRE